MKKNVFKGFTLVELIIVITILAILSTIAFISFQNYTKSARDSSRLSSIKNIQTGLELFYEKAGNYPSPDNGLTLTGNTGSYITQGTLGENVKKLIQLQNNIKDPLNGKELVYSTFKDGKYYQIASYIENNNNLSFINKTYADNLGVLVNGNYNFDPSLPSLITVNGSVSGSGIFDPNVCFVLSNGENNLNSTSSNCKKKVDMSLKNFDNGLVGYWDMESTTGGLLKDLSGNGNNGTGSGGVVIGGNLGVLGNATIFSSGSKQFFEVKNNKNLELKTFTINIIGYAPDDYSSMFIEKSNSGVYVGTFYPNYYIWKIGKAHNTHECGYGNDCSGIYSGSGYYETNMMGRKFNIDWLKYNFLSYTYDGNYLKSYLNGKLNGNYYINTNPQTGSGNLFIGIDRNLGRALNGIIDDIKIYNRSLSDQEILQQAKVAGF